MQYLTIAIILGILVGGVALVTTNKSQPINNQEPKESPTMSQQPASTPTNTKSYKEAQMVIEDGKSYTAKLKTSVGDITIKLNTKETPRTANNFIFLSQEGFYDGVIFHRTIPGFMIQGGDPTGTGMGGPGYKFADEAFTGEYTRGTVAMANAGKDTNGSQFFIMHKDYPLPPSYVIFGQVISGMETVDKIATAPTKSGGEGSSPVTPVIIEQVVVESE